MFQTLLCTDTGMPDFYARQVLLKVMNVVDILLLYCVFSVRGRDAGFHSYCANSSRSQHGRETHCSFPMVAPQHCRTD